MKHSPVKASLEERAAGSSNKTFRERGNTDASAATGRSRGLSIVNALASGPSEACSDSLALNVHAWQYCHEITDEAKIYAGRASFIKIVV